MASVLGDLWRIVDVQNYLGQEVLNVYHYRVTSVTGINDTGYQDVADWFEDTVIAAVRDVQADELNHSAIRIYNLSNGIDFLESPIDVDGAQSVTLADCLPSYVSIGFKLIRESLVTRNGYKRFAGIIDGAVSGNEFNGDPTQIADIEAALAADVVIGAVTLLEPIILASGTGAPPVATYQYSSIGSAQITQLGTQNTRKAGRGV